MFKRIKSTPWDLSRHTYDGNQLIDIGTKTTTVAIITEGEDSWLEDRANAAFIIRAVNAHDELIKALEFARSYFVISNQYAAVLSAVDVALAKAREEK